VAAESAAATTNATVTAATARIPRCDSGYPDSLSSGPTESHCRRHLIRRRAMTAAPEWRLPGSPAHRDASIFAQHVPHLALLVFYQVNQVAATVASGGRPK